MSISPVSLSGFGAPPSVEAPLSGRVSPAETFSELLHPKLGGAQETSTAVPVPPKQKIKEVENKQDKKAEEPQSVFDRPSLNSNDNAESAKPVESAEGFGFGDLIDAINPLQHIPILSSFYRMVTGDQIAGPAAVLGGLLYGGPLGMVVAAGNAIYAQEHNGADIVENAIAGLRGVDPQRQAPTTNIATDEDAAQTGNRKQSAETEQEQDNDESVNMADLPKDESAAPIPATPVTPVSASPIESIAPQQMPQFMLNALDKYQTLVRERGDGRQ